MCKKERVLLVADYIEFKEVDEKRSWVYFGTKCVNLPLKGRQRDNFHLL